MKNRQSLRPLVLLVAGLTATLAHGLSAAQFDLATATIADIDAALMSGALSFVHFHPSAPVLPGELDRRPILYS